jgi:DNA-binding transcriptional LysR family regulator
MLSEHGMQDDPITLRQLQALLAISDSGSIGAAPRKLGVTQPVLSRIIAQLERSAGVSLVSRGARGTVLTPSGLSLVSRARTISAELKRCEEDLQWMRGQTGGLISIAASPVPMMLVIPVAIRQLHQTLPDAEVLVSEVVYPQLQDAFRNQRIDFAVGPVPPGGLGHDFRVEPLFEVEGVIAVARNHPKASARSLAALRAEPWIIMGPVQGPGAVVAQLFESYGIEPPLCKVTLDTVWSAIEMISRTGFVGWVPKPIAESALERIRIVKVREALPPLKIGLITRVDTQLTTAARALISAVRARSRQLQHSGGAG